MGDNYAEDLDYGNEPAPASNPEHQQPPLPSKARKQFPQKTVDAFWEKVCDTSCLVVAY